jgi:hypothetical protein
MDKSIQVLQHNLGVVARRLGVKVQLTDESVARADKLAIGHGLFSGNRSTAFALVALKVLQHKFGAKLGFAELNIVLKSLAAAHDKCVLGDEAFRTVVITHTVSLSKMHSLPPLGLTEAIMRAEDIIEVCKVYHVARATEKTPPHKVGVSLAQAILATMRPKVLGLQPGRVDDELGYM